jgi:hypothetical protein
VKNVLDFFGSGVARLHAEAERADGAGDEHFVRGGFAGFARDFHAAAIEPLHFIGEAERRELEAIRAKSVGFDDMRARFDVGLVHAKNGFRLRGVQFIEAALRAHGFVQHRAHGAVGDEDGVLQPSVEIVNLHECEETPLTDPESAGNYQGSKNANGIQDKRPQAAIGSKFQVSGALHKPPVKKDVNQQGPLR